MNVQDTAIIVILLVIIALAIYGIIRRIRYGSSCCGSKNPGEKRIRVKDKNRSHYPYKYILEVEGMHCSNCARRIENAFNSDGGRWATADVGRKEVTLISKHEEPDGELKRITESAGYSIKNIIKQ